MNALICECCGGTINPETMQCEYCDTKYMDNSRINSLIIERMELEKENERLKADRHREYLYSAALEALRGYEEGLLTPNEYRYLLNMKEAKHD